jgi:hypothetical protein
MKKQIEKKKANLNLIEFQFEINGQLAKVTWKRLLPTDYYYRYGTWRVSVSDLDADYAVSNFCTRDMPTLEASQNYLRLAMGNTIKF